MERVETVLSRIKEAGLKFKPGKCHLLQTNVNFLGHTIFSDRVRPNPENMAKVKTWPIPQNVTQVRQILGLGSYYRRFIEGYSDLVRPLTQLTRESSPFIWSVECERSFQALRNKLTSAEIMAYPLNDGLLIHDTDASDTQISVILGQIPDGRERVISYGSRTLNKAEKNYCITDKEILAIRHFTEYYRQYLLGRKILVRSDHQALTFLFRLKEPKARIARWIEILSAFDFSTEYRRAEKHGNADSLTRCDNPWDYTCSDVDKIEPLNLKCGPCAKSKKRFKEMQSYVRPHGDDPSEQQTEQSDSTCVRTVTTRSQTGGNANQPIPGPSNNSSGPLNRWLSDQDLVRVQKFQSDDPDLAPIISALAKCERPPHSEVLALSPAVRYHWRIWNSVAWPTGVQLLVFFCSSVPVVLFDTPGISRCRSQHVVSVESSSLFHHRSYL